MVENTHVGEGKGWPAALLFAMAISALYLYLFYHWFAVADRYNLFLYYHNMRPLVPDTSPFSYVTASRYWMAGLVAGGVVLILHTGVSWLLGRLLSGFHSPKWQRVWLLTAVPLMLAIPVITMTANEPTLPAGLALWVTLVTLIGLALALLPGRLAAEWPSELALLTIDGLGLMLIITSMVGLERAGGWLERGSTQYVLGMIIVSAAGLILLGACTAIRFWLHRPGTGASPILLAGLIGAYLILPLLHHISFSDGYYYITDADNFLARSLFLQAGIWLLAAGLAIAFFRLRANLKKRRSGPTE
jgi:hypothetical protein